MPSEKQTEAWPLYGYAPGMYSAKCSQCGKLYQGEKRSFNCLECAVTQAKQALTAAEQAEPVPMYGDGQEVYTDPDGKVWHPHRGYWCQKMSHELAQAQKRIKELEAEPCRNPDCGCMFPRDCPSEPNWDGEPAPAPDAEREFNEVLEGAQEFNDDLPESMRRNARDWLRPDDEPATDAEPYLWLHPWNGSTSKHRSDIAVDCPKDGPQPIPLFTRPSESRLREALEEIANGCDGRVGRDILPCRIARAALAQEDGR